MVVETEVMVPTVIPIATVVAEEEQEATLAMAVMVALLHQQIVALEEAAAEVEAETQPASTVVAEEAEVLASKDKVLMVQGQQALARAGAEALAVEMA
jgi:1-aminocyclopropane-1-carboxylate deaminase/D-cysteine desulfhydrase-like pyridoxal-dependent ACC family enzyme